MEGRSSPKMNFSHSQNNLHCLEGYKDFLASEQTATAHFHCHLAEMQTLTTEVTAGVGSR